MSTKPTDDLKTAMQSLRETRAPAQPAPTPATRTPTPQAQTVKAPTKAKVPTVKAKAAARPRATKPAAPAILVPEIIEPCGSSGSKCGIEDESGMPEVNIKDQLTEKEQLFIEIYLAGGCSREEAMISAGYGDYSQSHLWGLSRKIIAKYESLAGEHRKTFRAVGAGEVSVAQGLLKLAETAKSEMVRLNAWTMIGKCLGLHQDVVAVNQGIQIVIKGRGEDSGKPAAQVQREPAKVLPRTMAITK